MLEYQKLKESIKILGLPEEATLDEIKNNYRRLSLKYHPDVCKEKNKKKCEEMFKKINDANSLIMTYCTEYKFSFKEKDIEENSLEKAVKEHKNRFYEDWL